MKKLLVIIITLTIFGCEKVAPDTYRWKTKSNFDLINKPISNVTKPIQKNYIKSSYELSNFELWFSSSDIYENGNKYLTNNPLTDMQSTQLDLNQDGLEDVFSYDGYDLKINPTPNPPPAIYYNSNGILDRKSYTGPPIKYPHGTKILLGDFNGDSLPDIFSMVAIDQPLIVKYPLLNENCHLIFNSKNGLSKVLEIDLQGFWYSGCSGDIDNDGDLDIIMFNMHQVPPIGNGVKNRILINNGSGSFTQDTTILKEFLSVTASELFDINKDGVLDLILNNKVNNQNELKILLGNGKSFFAKNPYTIQLKDVGDVINLDFVNINNDSLFEIIVFNYSNNMSIFKVQLFESINNEFIDNTSKYFNDNLTKRFSNLRVQDIDKNGFVDLFSTNKMDNVRWEWDGNKFTKK
jgi:hypothetical protein